tara:strand:+ start:4790 stop:5086 length:297 start_codon:yes stop_codon:yes gene_type:complete
MAIRIINYQEYEKNTLRGFITVQLQNTGLEIQGILHHKKDGKEWIYMPSRSYSVNGQQKHSEVIKFVDKNKAKAFQREVLDALREYQANGDKPNNVSF